MNPLQNSEELRIRPISLTDTDRIVKWRNSDVVKLHLFDRRPIDRQTHINWMRTQVETGACHQFIIEAKGDQWAWQPIGTSFLKKIDRIHGTAEFGIFIGEALEQGKGYGQLATKLTLKYGFQNLGLRTIYLYVFEDNLPALRLYEKLGFVNDPKGQSEYCDAGKMRTVLKLAMERENLVN